MESYNSIYDITQSAVLLEGEPFNIGQGGYTGL